MIIAQISDMHVKPRGAKAFGTVDTNAFLAETVQQINAAALRPDVVLATGDLVDKGTAEEYAALAELLQPLIPPLYVIPGNHDDRALIRAYLPTHQYLPSDGFLQYVIEDYPVRLIGLDTQIPGQSGGELCAARRDWLAARLAERPSTPTVLFLHHPPVKVAVDWLDRIGLADPEALGAIVVRNPQVERVLSGHFHRPIQVRWSGTIAATAPSTAHQFALTLEADAPRGWRMEPPGYLLHVWREDTGLVTHYCPLGDYGDARPFR